MMVDEMFDRDYQAGRAGLNRDIDRGIAGLIAGLRIGFHVLHRIQWSAPWAVAPTRSRRLRTVRRGGLA
jgi:hypothetical protein